MICRHYLITPNERKEVFPLNFSSNKFKFTLKEGKGKYYYTKELEGTISFINNDFALIKSLEEQGYSCNPLYLESFALIDGTYKMVYKAIMRIVDMKFDLDKCIINSPCKPFTPYLCLESIEDDEINILEKVPDRFNVYLFLGEYEFYESTNEYSVDFTKDYTNHANEYLWTDGGAPPQETCFRYYKLVERLGLNTSTGNLEGFGRSFWVREKYTIPTGSPSPLGYKFIETVGINDIYARPLMVFHSDYTSTQVPIGEITQTTFEWRYGALSNNSKFVTNAIKLQDVLEWYAEQCGLTVSSDFFQINPANPSPDNYVINARNQYTKLYLIQKTDVKKPNATQPATKGIMRLDYLNESLQTLFDTRYVIEGNTLKYEHISRFNKTVKLDATIIDNGKWVVGQRKFEFDSDEMPKKQLFKAMEQNNVDFVGKPIEYFDNCTDKANEQKNNCQNITTDILHVIDQPDKISDEGFVLVACEEHDGKLYLAQTTGILTNNEVGNNVLGFAQLHNYFHRHRRIRKTGILNGITTTFLSEKPSKKCVDITFPFKDITLFEPDQLVKGPLGNGEVKQALYEIKNDTLKVTLMITNAVGSAPGIPDDNGAIPKSIFLKIVLEDKRPFSIPYPNPYGFPGPGYDGFLYNLYVYAWADAAATIPAYPSNFIINYKNKYYRNGTQIGGDDQVPKQIAGHKTLLQNDVWGDYTDTDGNNDENVFELYPSSNYTII